MTSVGALGPRIVVAMDYATLDEAMAMAAQLDPADCRLKVGKELFTRCGPAVVEALQSRGFDVFLDLKFHDIPNTTAQAVRAAAELGVWMVNVHTGGGRRMMEAARDILQPFRRPPLLIGVTVLTSMDRSDLAELGSDMEPADRVLQLANLAKSSGLDGVVCSAQESTALKNACGSDFALVTPGIRPAFAVAGDQRRIMTPAEALQAGSDYLVIGRPITQAVEPAQAVKQILAEMTPYLA